MPNTRTRGNRQELIHRKFPLNMRSVGDHPLDCPERLGSLPHWKYSRTVWMQFCSVHSGMALPEQGGWNRSTVVPFNLIHFMILPLPDYKSVVWGFCSEFCFVLLISWGQKFIPLHPKHLVRNSHYYWWGLCPHVCWKCASWSVQGWTE